MSERKMVEGMRVEHKETKEKPTEVARVFLFQSIDPVSLPDTNHIESWNFTNTILIRKGGTKTHDQLSPIGGKVNEGERRLAAVRRETVEETHLRATEKSTRELKTSQEYSMELPNHHETLRRKAYYFLGQIMPRPMDRPYALDVEEDKIQSFVYLNVAEFRQLLSEGEIIKDGVTMPLLDSLRTDDKRTELLTTDNTAVEKIHAETLAQFRKVEAAKKLSVLEHLMWAVRLREFSESEEDYPALDEDRQGVFQQIEDLRKILDRAENKNDTESTYLEAITQAELLWKEVVQAYACTPEEVRRALKNSNIEEARDHSSSRFDLETGAGIPTVILTFPLLITDEADLRERRTLMRNPEMRRLMKISDTFWHLREVQKNGKEAAKSLLTLAKRFKISPDRVLSFSQEAIPSELINYLDASTFAPTKEAEFPEQETKKHILIEKEFFAKIPELSARINEYFQTLSAAADVKNTPLDQHSLVKKADLLRLWDIAFNADAELPIDPEERKIVRWEASRKLGLMMLMFRAEQIQNKVVEAGIEPIQNIENALGSFAVTEEKGSSVVKTGVFGYENYEVKTYARQKDLLSYFRKVIVRDELSEDEAMDTFAKSIVLTETSEKALSALKIESCDFEDQLLDEEYKKVGVVKMPRFMRELIDSILEEGQRQGQLVRIVKYKGFPEEGKKFSASSGPGATGKIRMGKFYIEHIAPDGTVRNREMQVFLPRIVRNAKGAVDHIESGEVDFEAKKADDKDYSVSRLFATKALRSFMELLYPAEIYGDSIRPIYKTKAK